MMHLITRFLVLALLLLQALPIRQVQAAGLPPAHVATEIREALFNAQVELEDDPAESQNALSHASSSFSGDFAQSIQAAAPQAHARIKDGFNVAAQAIADGQVSAFSAARAQIWTSILAASFTIVELAVQQNDLLTAEAWLPVREFRTTTRFSRPNTGATQALEALAQEKITPSEALLSVKADLYDTYQAELIETLHNLPEAHQLGYAIRSVELAAFAQGYFLILSPAYLHERGESDLQTALFAFSNLREATTTGQDMENALLQVEAALFNFRAAPLTPEEQARRAGQVLRYLSLVPIEYGRGVEGNQIIHDFEIQEAITFHAGAYAAFADLENLLDAIDHNMTIQVKTGLDDLGQLLSLAAKNEKIAPAESIQSQAQTLANDIKAIMPAEWIQNSSTGDFDVIASMLDQMEAAVISKDYDAAESARLEAYAIMEVGPEAHLMAFAPELKIKLEDLFWNGQPPEAGLAYLIKNEAAYSEIRTARTNLDNNLEEAQTLLAAGSAPAAVAVNAGMIMFREGLEAVVILASLMSSMKRKDEQKYRKPMWLGALLALAATVLTWVLAHDVLQSLARYGEKLEAVVSLIAIAVLLVIMNWFFHKLYWSEWISGFQTRKRRIISGETGLWLGLVMLGFTSVYREGFETVLFLQALVLESGIQVVLIGVLAALAAVCMVGFITFKLQVNLPYKKMLIVTGVLIGAVLLQMVGSTVHVLQVVGWLPIHAISGGLLPYWMGTWFGIYATWEGLAFQALAATFVIGSYYLAEWLMHHRISRKQTIPQANAQADQKETA